MKTKVFTLAALLCCASAMYAQESGYKFTTVASQKATPVKNQASTGTCWCFATTSFMESELLRMGKGEYDLSEMFIVRQKYLNQLEDNYYRGGNGNLGQAFHTHGRTLSIKWVSYPRKYITESIITQRNITMVKW